jgi:uncharacterized protein YndB with AHSA1/START domain
MYDIRHRVGIRAPRHRVYEMLATKEGLAEFWSTTEGDSAAGGKLSFFFGSPEPAAVMEVTELSPDERVRWRVVDGVPDWVGTTLTFELKEDGGETVLLFTHADWPEPSEILHHSSTKWATYLLGLRSGLEGGSFTAFPDDTRISSVWQ